MCNLPRSRPSDTSITDNNVDMINFSPVVGSEEEDVSDKENRMDKGRDSKIEGSRQYSSLLSRKKNSTIPHIPFSSTFWKAEKHIGIKTEKLRLPRDRQISLKRSISDGEKPLRRRARSSEGYMLRNNILESFKDCSHLDKRNHEATITFTSLSNPGIRRRKTNNSPSHRNNEQSTEFAYGERNNDPRRSVIPIEHPFKIGWDVLTVVLSIAHSYLTHMAIRDRQFEASPFISFCQAWFLMDILLNFFTERKTSTGEIICDHRRIVARYLTSWFAVDILSLIPWEVLYVKPLIDLQNRRGFFKKSFFRSKAVVRVTRHLRGKHFRWFGAVAKQTKHHGIGAQRLLRLIIKYVPKYIMFLKNMKGVVAMRILRFVHWSRRSIKNIETKASDVSTKNTSCSRLDDDGSVSDHDGNSYIWKNKSFEIVYDWERIDDDGIPM